MRIAERIRAGFEAAAVEVAGYSVGTTVSIGAATSYELVTNIDALIARADVALYRAKGEGRNRLRAADAESENERVRLIDAAPGQATKLGGLLRRKNAA